MKTVSIIIPTYNRAEYLPQAIESVRAQSYQDWEMIIIDDCSTDNTQAVVASFLSDSRIRLVRNETNQGIAKNRNRGIELARGQYIAMLDSDDVWIDREKLAKQVDFLNKHSDCVLVGTFMKEIDTQGKEIADVTFAETDNSIRASLLYKNHIAQSSVVFRKEIAQAVGGYDETLTTMEDHGLWLKMATHGTVAVLPSYSLGYRVHESSVTKKRALRVALDDLSVMWRHRREFQGITIGIIKSVVRIIRALFS